ncbi:hypothetical protein [Leuconostoc mesenteroides]|uniref:hypothetical protein n=1 Tax=Leuconostoc mesenteroides TaxID=1245 RepID=UPI0023631745|nr:hypothetical protein [Leuconostoc mesenteroides]
MSRKKNVRFKAIKNIKKNQAQKNKKRTFWSFIACFVSVCIIGVLLSAFSVSKYEIDAVKKSVSEQKSIKINDLKVSLNTYPGGDEVVETLDNNKLNQKFLDLIQKSSADDKKVVKISKNSLSLNQARILLNALQKKKINNVATSAKNKTQSLIFKIVKTMFIVIFLASLLFLHNTTLVMDEVNAITFIGTAIKEIISFLFFSIGLYTVINSLFVGDNISTVASLSKSMTFLYAWMPVNIILLAGMSIFNIYSKTNE